MDAIATAAEEEANAGGGRRPRFLCLHGYRGSGDIMREVLTAIWPEEVIGRLDLVFPNAPFPAEGLLPPRYEWFQSNEDFTEYTNLDVSFGYVEDLMIKEGPFDGLMGFSQGGVLSSGIVGLQTKGLALTRVPKLKALIFIESGKFRNQALAKKAYGDKIDCTSLHIIGDLDIFKKDGEELVEAFVNPYVIRHPYGHIVPQLDDKSLETMLNFLQKIEEDLSADAAAKNKHQQV